MKTLNLLSKEKITVLADQLIVSGSAFLTNIILAKTLGLERYGVFSSIGLIQLFILSVFIAFSSQVFQVVYTTLSDKDKTIYKSGLFYIIIGITLLITITGVIIYLLSDYYLFLCISISTVLLLLQDYLRKFFLTDNQSSKALYIDLITNLLQLSLLLLFGIVFSINVIIAITIIGITFIPSVIYGIICLKPSLPSIDAIKFAWKIHKEKSGWLVLSSFFQWFGGYFFVLAAGWWIGAAALGALRLSQYIFGTLNVLLQAIENYLLPKMNFSDDKLNYQKVITKKMLLLMCPIIICLVIFSNQILSISGGLEFVQYSYVMFGLGTIYLIMTIAYPVRMLIRSSSLNKEFFIGYVLMVVFSLISAPFLIKSFQLYGVLAGLLLTQLISLIYWWIVLKKKFGSNKVQLNYNY